MEEGEEGRKGKREMNGPPCENSAWAEVPLVRFGDNICDLIEAIMRRHTSE